MEFNNVTTQTALSINGLSFDGPYDRASNLDDAEGVYVVLSRVRDDHFIIDVGHSKKVRTRVETHDRKRFWAFNALGFPVVYAAHYMPHAGELYRALAETGIREQYSPPCGMKYGG